MLTANLPATNQEPSVLAANLQRLVVVGGGMASHGFCKSIVELGVHEQHDVLVFGEEPRTAYDRVNLSRLFSDKAPNDLLLSPPEWYSSQGIRFATGIRITQIDRSKRVILDDGGTSFPYDKLVLATGSRPWVPPIPGANLRGVFTYRTLDDLTSIREFVEASKVKRSAILGGGLLGLEAAKMMLGLGLEVSVVEMAPSLMPKQLDAGGAQVLRRRIEQLGVEVLIPRRTHSIRARQDGLRIFFQNGQPLDVGIVIVAAGVRPRDELAEAAGLKRGPMGGFAVDRQLQTNDPSIYAIGECASFEDRCFGLVAPCYRMAEVLADRLAGTPRSFEGADESAELKLLEIPVKALGRALGSARGGVVVKHEDDAGYRKLILEQGRVVGASSVGEWDDVDSVRLAVNQNKRLWPHQRYRFQSTGRITAGATLPVTLWPPTATVCACHGVQRLAITDAIAAGATDFDSLVCATQASTSCGNCEHLVRQALGEVDIRNGSRLINVGLVASAMALMLAIAYLLLPPLRFATSVQDEWYQWDFLWRDSFAKQVSGYALLGTTLAGLIFSLHKRTKLLRIGHYGVWRTIHFLIGAAVVGMLLVHTGLRLGANLNLALSLSFLSVIVAGAFAGIASSLEASASGKVALYLRLWRPRLSRGHLWLCWPLPILIILHIFCVYWF